MVLTKLNFKAIKSIHNFHNEVTVLSVEIVQRKKPSLLFLAMWSSFQPFYMILCVLSMKQNIANVQFEKRLIYNFSFENPSDWTIADNAEGIMWESASNVDCIKLNGGACLGTQNSEISRVVPTSDYHTITIQIG